MNVVVGVSTSGDDHDTAVHSSYQTSLDEVQRRWYEKRKTKKLGATKMGNYPWLPQIGEPMVCEKTRR